MLVTVFAILVTIIHYLWTLASSIEIPKSSPMLSHQHNFHPFQKFSKLIQTFQLRKIFINIIHQHTYNFAWAFFRLHHAIWDVNIGEGYSQTSFTNIRTVKKIIYVSWEKHWEKIMVKKVHGNSSRKILISNPSLNSILDRPKRDCIFLLRFFSGKSKVFAIAY